MQNSENIVKQYLNAQVNYDEIKTGITHDALSAVKCVNSAEQEAEIEYNKFKEKLKAFDGITTISAAKKIARTFLPIDNEKNYLKVGKAKCLIISRGDVFRICLDTDEEYICYNFIKKAQ